MRKACVDVVLVSYVEYVEIVMKIGSYKIFNL
jgi:hypothetical protein